MTCRLATSSIWLTEKIRRDSATVPGARGPNAFRPLLAHATEATCGARLDGIHLLSTYGVHANVA